MIITAAPVDTRLPGIGEDNLLAACERAAGRLYDAEVALHYAHQSHVDAWISAAYDKLHIAIEAHTAAAALADRR